MNHKQRQRIIDAQRDAFKRHGYHPNALLWSNTEIQQIRFKVLSDIGIESGDSILDVGCGFGDYDVYLQKSGKTVDYTGLDLSAELILEGRKRFPEIELIIGDLFDLNPAAESYDYVALSGALNRKLDYLSDKQEQDSSKSYARRVIKRMFQTCRKGVAFNVLDARHEWTANRWDLLSFHPDEMSDFISQSIRPERFQIIDGYLENDFTVYLYKTKT